MTCQTSRVSKLTVWWNHTTTAYSLAFSDDKRIAILQLHYFHNYACDSYKVSNYDRCFWQLSALLEVWQLIRSDERQYRPTVLTVRTIETTDCNYDIYHLVTTIVLKFSVFCHSRHVVFCGECNNFIIAHVEISRKNNDENHHRVSVFLHIMLSSWYRRCSIDNSSIIRYDCDESIDKFNDKSKLLFQLEILYFFAEFHFLN